ncbi:FAD-binding protein [Streptomyces sp. 4N509B]|uniref:FAD-binding protein n=1 Tax=Streptomyces sp. 4N509B TaxID=3457413 RepID=UPI003FCF3D0B
MLTTGTPGQNWAGNLTFGAARVHRPASVGELRRIVAGARRVRALGSGHSFSRVADSDDELVRVDGLPRRVEVDADARRVTVTAGMRYAEVAAALHARGFALANMASLPHISVAGSVATGTHGSGNALRGLASAVTGLELVGADGGLARLERGEPGFDGAVVSLGALGVVTALTLEIEPAFEVAQWVYLGVPLAAVAPRYVTDVAGAAYSVSLFTDWHGGTGTVVLKRRTDREDAGHLGEEWQGGRLADEPWHPVPGMPPAYCTEQLGSVGPWHERLPHFRPEFTPSNGEELQSELFLPRAAAPEAFAALGAMGAAFEGLLQVSEVRTIAAEEQWLSPAYGRDSVAFHFTWVRDVEAVLPVLAAVEERLLPLGARPHWGKLTTAAGHGAGAGGRYERLADFARLVAERDPEGRFRNAYVDEVLASLA